MIKAILKMVDGQHIIFLGLEQGNIDLLKQGKPILIELKEMGMSGEILISFGETKQEIMADLQKAGLFPPSGSQN